MKIIVAFIGMIFFFSVSIASAITISFGDNSNYWPGWGNGSGDDFKDTIGTPDFLGGSAEITTDSYLTNLTFQIRAKAYLNLWRLLEPSDLFIDRNADDKWDYYVDLVDTIQNDGTVDPGDGQLYSISHPIGDPGYLQSKVPPGYGYRENHPVGFEGGTQYGTVTFSGWPSKPGSVNEVVQAGFDFGAQDILLGPSFIIGWTQTCANDVIYETIDNPIPEPATLLLLGSGLVGMGWFGRKRFRK